MNASLPGATAPENERTKLAPHWVARLKRATRRSIWISILVLAWIGAFNFGLVDEFLYGTGALLLSVPLFVLSLPLGFILRLDNMFVASAGDWTQGQKLGLLLVAAVTNLFLVTIAFGFYRDLKERLGIKGYEKPAKKPKKEKKKKEGAE